MGLLAPTVYYTPVDEWYASLKSRYIYYYRHILTQRRCWLVKINDLYLQSFTPITRNILILVRAYLIGNYSTLNLYFTLCMASKHPIPSTFLPTVSTILLYSDVRIIQRYVCTDV